MPPKKKVASKSKETLTASNENLTNVTVRRPIKNNVEETLPIVQPVLINEKQNLDVTVVIEKMFESDAPVSLPSVEPVEIESENVKKVQKKVVKSKPKLKSKQLEEEEESKPKKGRKRAVSEDRTIVYPEQKAIKSRKKASSKDVTDASCDVISPNKRGRRAASVDILSSDIMVSLPKEMKRNRKVEKPPNDFDEDILKNASQEDDQPKPAEKVVKGRKNTKKVVEKQEEKETFEIDQGSIVNDVPKTSQEKPKSKRGASKKEQMPEGIEEMESTEKKKVIKTTKSTRGAPKSKQTEENEVEKKIKRAPRGKPVVKSYSEESEDNEQDPENVEDMVTDKLKVTPKEKISKTKIKRAPKGKQVVKSYSDESEDNEQDPENVEDMVTDKLEVTPNEKISKTKIKRAPKGKQGVKSYSEESEDNEQDPENVEDVVTDKLEVTPEDKISKTKTKPVKAKEMEKKAKRIPKAKQITKSSEESEDNNDLDVKKNIEAVKETSISPTKINEAQSVDFVEEKEVEKKQKRVPRGKQIQKSYEDLDSKNDIDSEKNKSDSVDVNNESPEKVEPKPKAKRGVRREKQNLAEPKIIEELHQKFSEKNLSPTSDEENTGDLPVGQPSTPESGKNEVQPVVKRKPKGKTTKK